MSKEAFNIAADRAINSLGACDDEFNHWHLDHGNLRHLFWPIYQAALTEAAKVARDMNGGWASDDHLEVATAIENLKGDGE